MNQDYNNCGVSYILVILTCMTLKMNSFILSIIIIIVVHCGM